MPSPPDKKLSLAVIASWFVFLGWSILVLWASLDSRPFRPLVRLLSWDKLQHAVAYALLTLFCGLALRTLRFRHPYQCWFGAALFSFCYGGVVELLQLFATRHRQGDILDLLANILGSAMVLGVALLFERRGASA